MANKKTKDSFSIISWSRI